MGSDPILRTLISIDSIQDHFESLFPSLLFYFLQISKMKLFFIAVVAVACFAQFFGQAFGEGEGEDQVDSEGENEGGEGNVFDCGRSLLFSSFDLIDILMLI